MSKTPEMQKFLNDFAVMLFGETPEDCCVMCKKKFSEDNIFTEAGWQETTISKMCEVCFNKTTKEE